MEARDQLEEELSQARQALEAVQQQHDQLAADLQEATTSQPAARPKDTARIAHLADQVSPLVNHSSTPLWGPGEGRGFEVSQVVQVSMRCRVMGLLVFPCRLTAWPGNGHQVLGIHLNSLLLALFCLGTGSNSLLGLETQT